jgi:DNA helicase-2/ATP-dependent DNA helicase PcrA
MDHAAENHDREDHIDRVENIRQLYRIAVETDDTDQNPRDALTEFLTLTALSNSELDSLLEKKPQIPIITVHQAKGLEFDYVFLACLQEGTFPLGRAENEELSEEKRLFYVALTRAKKRLCLSWHKRDGRKTNQPSRFLASLPSEDVEEQ